MQSIATIPMSLRIERIRAAEIHSVYPNRPYRENMSRSSLSFLTATTKTSFWIHGRGQVRGSRRSQVSKSPPAVWRGMKLANCPTYIREWMDRERD